MAKVVILKTNKGVMMMGGWQCSNGAYWTAENCYKYCNSEDSDFFNSHQAHKLMNVATHLGFYPKAEEYWYKNRDNFVDIEIGYDEVDQEDKDYGKHMEKHSRI